MRQRKAGFWFCMFMVTLIIGAVVAFIVLAITDIHQEDKSQRIENKSDSQLPEPLKHVAQGVVPKAVPILQEVELEWEEVADRSVLDRDTHCC